MNALPVSYWVVFVAFVLAATAAGLAGRALVGSLSHSGRRVARFPRSEAATTVVEFPFALMTLVIISLLTWQLGFLLCGYLVVDRAAFAAVRAAVVTMGNDSGVPAGKDKVEQEAPDDAAVAVCVPISGLTISGSPVSATTKSGRLYAAALAARTAREKKVAGDDEGIRRGLPVADYVRRYQYAVSNTTVERKTRPPVAGGGVVTVEVRHAFFLSVPFADRILGNGFAIGWGSIGRSSEISAQATMVSEAYPEAKPRNGIGP